SNHINGCVPIRLCYVRPVQVLDISYSSILGDIIIVSMIDLQMVQKKNSIAIINVVVVGELFKRPIPTKIDQLTMLHALDLSRNQPIGKIPEGISQLGLLGVLSLSNNKLSGKIPSGTKLQTLDASSYM
ncbi:hypothetical protein CISIN_1g0393941mg, partial [Citrus sinensis]